MKRYIKHLLTAAFLFTLLVKPNPVFAKIIGPEDMGACGTGELYTAIGCVPANDTNAFTAFILRWAMGIGGGVALALIAYSGIQMALAAGDPAKVGGAKSLFTASITGLLFMVFSAFILRFVGIDILNIPGL